mmetsp:Transcript_9540/g.15625  ORF Transcript_9540/g.15625 Transcript_9540/m.15625 type:complete len:366 (+) Transcript_9540:75-1172(+)
MKGVLPATFVEGFHDEQACLEMEYRPLFPNSTDILVSAVSLGGSGFGDAYEKVDESGIRSVVELALKKGVNMIDTAHWYGHGKSEQRLGKALEGIPRKAYYIHTKCCRYERDIANMFDFSAERTLLAIDQSIERLGCEYLDCMQVHDVEYAPSIEYLLSETIPALVQARASGKIKRIGICGYPIAFLKELLQRTQCRIDTCLFYCHYSLNDATLMDETNFPFFSQRVGIINACALSMGLLTKQGPPSWHPAPREVKDACKAAVDYCNSKGVNISKLAFEFTLREKRIPTTLTSMTTIDQVRQNLDSAKKIGELSQLENETLEYIREHFFGRLKTPTWEGVEVGQYQELKKRIEEGETIQTTLSTN